MMKDLDIKNKRILLFDFDGTLIETASGNTFATDLTDMIMPGMDFSQLKGCSLMVGDASGLPGQFSDSDKVCAENAGIDYMDVVQFVGK